MKRLIPIRDPAADRIVVEQRAGHRLAFRVERAGGGSTTLRLTYSEANSLAESLREVAGTKIGNQAEFNEPGGPGDDLPG